MSDDATIRRENLLATGLTPSQLVIRLGRTPSFWSDVLRGRKSFGEKLARAIEEGLEMPRGSLDIPADSRHVPSMREGTAVAHPMRLDAITVHPIVPWEELMRLDELPETFEAAMPDDSMAPRVRAGELVTYSRAETPRPGDGVLVADSAGNHYLRIFRQRRPGSWEAHAINEAYQPLESERDGLVVRAVLVGVRSRWA